MNKLYKLTEWASASGLRWYCNDVDDLAGVGGKWWVPAYVLDLSFEDYIMLLKNKYHVTLHSYDKEKDLLIFSFEKYNDCHSFVLYVNRIARQKNFKV